MMAARVAAELRKPEPVADDSPESRCLHGIVTVARQLSVVVDLSC